MLNEQKLFICQKLPKKMRQFAKYNQDNAQASSDATEEATYVTSKVPVIEAAMKTFVEEVEDQR